MNKRQIFVNRLTMNHFYYLELLSFPPLCMQKRKEREVAVKNGRLTEDQRLKWVSVMKNEYMSSEESGLLLFTLAYHGVLST